MRSLISADSHVFEPPALWQERLPESMRDRGPRLEASDGYWCLVVEGIPPRKLAKIEPASSAATREESGNGEADGETDAEMGPRATGGADAALRKADMARDGVIAEVIYPTHGLFVDLIEDPELQMACARVYNDWLHETFRSDAEVFIGAALVPVRDVAAAATELQRVAGLGFRSAMIPTSAPEGARYNDPVYEPLWSVAAEAHIPLSLHVGTGAVPQSERGPGGAVINYTRVGLIAADALTYFVSAGVLAAHPDLHVVFVESGAGWLPHVCERMDEAYEEHQSWVRPKLDLLPSEYVRRQCHVTLGADRSPILARQVCGLEPLMWASDYPHPEGTFPESQRIVEEIFAGVPADEVDAIVGGNAAAVYGIEVGKLSA